MLTCFKLLKPIDAVYKWQMWILDLCKTKDLYQSLELLSVTQIFPKQDLYVDKIYGGLPKFHFGFYQWAGGGFIHLNGSPENFAEYCTCIYNRQKY